MQAYTPSFMAEPTLIKSRQLAADASGVLLDVTPGIAGWDFVRFAVRRVAAGATLRVRTTGEECALVLLNGSGQLVVDGGSGVAFGPRRTVFDSYPHALYLPAGHAAVYRAEEASDIAECRAPSTALLEPRIVTPDDCGYEVRGGGNATRQIVDIMPPAFPADRLLICEVYTPSGNWSSYPPHKHDVDNPPFEADLEEIYYYRMREPDGFGFQRLYTADGSRDQTVTVVDGDVVLVRDGYHPFVTAYGHDAYYLNVLAGTRRSMAASDDPRYAAVRSAWPPPDPRVPVVAPPAAAIDYSSRRR
jgi:5-deoxy-glucuronate isomerase